MPGVLSAQDFADYALPNFPVQTVRVEYFSPATLRALPGYSRIRKRFVGPRLQILEESFSSLGVREENIDEMVIGWMASPRGHKTLGGLARGRFDSAGIAASGEQLKISPTAVGDWKAYCVDEESSCVVVLDGTLAAFGPVDFLVAIREAREGQSPSLLSSPRFINLLSQIRSQPPLWGIALGETVSDWFRVWLAGPLGATIDWTPLLQSVEALTFYADMNEKVELHLNLDFRTAEAANRMRQTLETLRQLQQILWQNQVGGRPNPLDAVELSGADSRISLTAITDYAQLEESNQFSAAD